MRFFIVDDSPAAIILVRKQLLERVDEVEDQTDSSLAVDRIGGATPVCVIDDLMMPGVDGSTLSKRVRGHTALRAHPHMRLAAGPLLPDRGRATPRTLA